MIIIIIVTVGLHILYLLVMIKCIMKCENNRFLNYAVLYIDLYITKKLKTFSVIL